MEAIANSCCKIEKVKELTLTLNVALEFMKEFDKTMKQMWSPLRMATARLEQEFASSTVLLP